MVVAGHVMQLEGKKMAEGKCLCRESLVMISD